MKQLEFTPGGGPNKVDYVIWLQAAMREALMPLYRKQAQLVTTDASVPVAVEGCSITVSAGTVQVSAGWVYWQPAGAAAPGLYRVPATTLAVNNEASASMRLQTFTGPHTEVMPLAAGGSLTIQYPGVVPYADSPPATGTPFVEQYLLPTPSNSPGGTFFVLTALRYGGAALGEVRYMDWTAAELAAQGFVNGQGYGVWAGWQVDTEFAGRTLIGVGTLAGNTYNPGDTGGAATHTLTLGQMPRHNHSGQQTPPNDGDPVPVGVAGLMQRSAVGQPTPVADTGGSGTELRSDVSPVYGAYEGENEPHNNMQPFYATYILRKTR